MNRTTELLHVRFANGQFELDEQSHQLERSGVSVSIQPQPLRLLCFLIRERGRLVPRDEISAFLKDSDYEPNIDKAMSLLRKALGNCAKLIETKHTYGYRFRGEVELITRSEAEARAAIHGGGSDNSGGSGEPRIQPIEAVERFLANLDEECRIHRQKLFPPVPAKIGPDQIDIEDEGDFVPLYVVEQGNRVKMLDAMQQQPRRLLLIGRPGAGKTTLTLITASAIRSRKWKLPAPGPGGLPRPLPVLIRLPSMAYTMRSAKHSNQDTGGLEFADPIDFVAAHLTERGLPKELVKQTLGTGSYVFLLDGLDEVPSHFNISTVLRRLSERIRDDWMIVCSRPISEEILRDLGRSFCRLHLSDLAVTEKWDLLHKRFRQRAEFDVFWTKLNGLPTEWAELTSTPLMLSVLVYLAQKKALPDKWDLCDVYGRAIEVLLGEFADMRRGQQKRFERGQRVRLFDAMCAASFERNGGRIDAQDISVTEPDFWPDQCPIGLLDSFWEDDPPIFPGPPDKKEPLHRTFMEFGYARFLSKRPGDSTNRIVAHWDEFGHTSWVPLFFVQLAPEKLADRLAIRLAQKVDDTSPEAFLSYARVIYYSRHLRERHKSKLEPRLMALWRSGTFGATTNRPVDMETRREAARCLGIDPDFVARLCDRLEHPRDDEDLSVTVDLLRDMRSPHSYRQLVNCLDAKDNRVRWVAAVSLGELSYFGAVDEFLRNHRFGKEEDWDVQMAMLKAACRVPSDRFDELVTIAISTARRDVVTHIPHPSVRVDADKMTALRHPWLPRKDSGSQGGPNAWMLPLASIRRSWARCPWSRSSVIFSNSPRRSIGSCPGKVMYRSALWSRSWS